MSESELFLQSHEMSTPLSFAIGYGLALVPVLAVFGRATRAAVRSFRRVRRLRAEVLDGARRPLRPGPATVRGRVARLDEERRRFILRLASGIDLPVEADAVRRTDPLRLQESVPLADGAELFVPGVLVEEIDREASATYRDSAATRLVMRGTGSDGTVELTAELAFAESARARAELAWIGWSVIVLATVHVVVLGRFHLRVLLGSSRGARVVAHDTRETISVKRGGGTDRRPVYELLVDDGGQLAVDPRPGGRLSAGARRGRHLPLRHRDERQRRGQAACARRPRLHRSPHDDDLRRQVSRPVRRIVERCESTHCVNRRTLL
jgi:hypothetical protein